MYIYIIIYMNLYIYICINSTKRCKSDVLENHFFYSQYGTTGSFTFKQGGVGSCFQSSKNGCRSCRKWRWFFDALELRIAFEPSSHNAWRLSYFGHHCLAATKGVKWIKISKCSCSSLTHGKCNFTGCPDLASRVSRWYMSLKNQDSTYESACLTKVLG